MKEKFISVSLVECPFLLSSYAAACDSNKKYEQQMIDNFSHVCLNTVHFLGFTICGILNHEKKLWLSFSNSLKQIRVHQLENIPTILINILAIY